LAPFFSEGTSPTVLRQIVSTTYRPLFGKVWLSSSLAMKQNAEFTGGGKNGGRVFGTLIGNHTGLLNGVSIDDLEWTSKVISATVNLSSVNIVRNTAYIT